MIAVSWVEDCLHTVSGRRLSTLNSHWQSEVRNHTSGNRVALLIVNATIYLAVFIINQ